MSEPAVIVYVKLQWFEDGERTSELELRSYDLGVAEALRFALDQVMRDQAKHEKGDE